MMIARTNQRGLAIVEPGFDMCAEYLEVLAPPLGMSGNCSRDGLRQSGPK
jgi:hypothetical protein